MIENLNQKFYYFIVYDFNDDETFNPLYNFLCVYYKFATHSSYYLTIYLINIICEIF